MTTEKLPLPFTITIYGLAYDLGADKKTVFRNPGIIKDKIETLLQEEVADGVSLDLEFRTHSFRYRNGIGEETDRDTNDTRDTWHVAGCSLPGDHLADCFVPRRNRADEEEKP